MKRLPLEPHQINLGLKKEIKPFSNKSKSAPHLFDSKRFEELYNLVFKK